MALVMPTSQITVAARLRTSGNTITDDVPVIQGRSMAPMRTPCDHTTMDTAIWPASRGHGDNAKRSSARPMTKKHSDPASVVQIN